MTNRSSRAAAMAHLGALLIVGIWGASFVSTKVLLDNSLTPTEIYILRFLLAYLIVLAICHRRLWSRTAADELLFAVCGMCAGSVYFLAENTALEYTLTTNVALLTSTSPLFTAVLAGMLYRSERLSRGAWLGSGIAFVGVGCVIFNSSTSLEVRPLGDLLSLLAAISWSVYSLVLRRLNAVYDIWFITRKTFFYGVLTAVPFLLLQKPNEAFVHALQQPEVWFNIGFLGLLASLLCFALWARIVKVLGAISANNYMYLQPIFTMIISAIVLSERVGLMGYMGIALILGGLALGDRLSGHK